MLRKNRPQPVATEVEDVELIKQKLADAEAEIAGFESIQEIANLEIRDLKKQLEELRQAQTPAPAPPSEVEAELRAALAQKDREIANLRANSMKQSDFEVEALRIKANQTDYLVQQLETARATIAKLEGEMLSQSAVSPALAEQAFAQVRALEAEVAGLRDDFDRSEALRKRAEADAHNAIQELAAARARLTELESHGTLADDLRMELETMAAKVANREETISELRKETSILTAKVVALQSELEDSRAARISLETEITHLRNEVSNLSHETGEADQLKNQIAQLKSELEEADAMRQARAHLQNRIDDLEFELREARMAADEVASLRHRIQQLEADAVQGRDMKDDVEYVRAILSQALTRLNASTQGGDLPGFLAPLPKTA